MNTQNLVVRLGIFMCVSVAPISAYAYLDPGTGSILLQGIVGAVVAAFVALKLYWYRVKGFVAKLFGRAPSTVEALDDIDTLK